MVFGHPFLATNLPKPAEHAAGIMSDTVSMCTTSLPKQTKSAISAVTTVRVAFRHRSAKSISTIPHTFVETSIDTFFR